MACQRLNSGMKVLRSADGQPKCFKQLPDVSKYLIQSFRYINRVNHFKVPTAKFTAGQKVCSQFEQVRRQEVLLQI